jgi:hypothetical protein
MKKNVARILRYALEQLVIVERLKSVTAEVTKGTGRAVASIHNALWLLESEDSEVPAVKRLRSYPSTKAEAEALQEFLDTDVVIHESIIKKKYEESFDLPETPPQSDPPGGWTPEAIDAAKFPESVKQTAQLSFVAKPLKFLPEMVGGDEIQEASAFNYVFQISGHTPAKWRYGTVREMSRRSVPWEDVATFSDAIHVCNAVWREILSDYVTVEQPKPEIELPEKVIRWIALGKNAEAVILNGFKFCGTDLSRVDSLDSSHFYMLDAKNAVKEAIKESCPK